LPQLKRHNLMRALLLAPLATPICVLLWSLLQGKIDNSHGGFELLTSLCSTFIIFGVPAELTAIVLGLPCWLLYRRLGISSPIAYALGGLNLANRDVPAVPHG